MLKKGVCIIAKRKGYFVKPFVKWVGGKGQLLDTIRRHLPPSRDYTRYYEPFVGGGAVFWDLQPSSATINDSNAELINLYQVIRDDVENLIEELKKYENEEVFFYKIRNLDRDHFTYSTLSKIQKAARVHYLNKTCYNGLFRVNNAGEFNSPFGRYTNPDIVNEVKFRAVSKYLNENDIEILCGDFGTSLKSIGKKSFVYFDPPYDPISDSSSFTGYTKGGFGQQSQLSLKKMCDNLDSKGVKFLLSNSNTEFVREIYKNYKIYVVEAKRAINCNGAGRGNVEEVLIKNYD